MLLDKAAVTVPVCIHIQYVLQNCKCKLKFFTALFAGMASLVEMQDLTQVSVVTSSLLADSEVHALVMSNFQSVPGPLPTPPLSPEHIDSSPPCLSYVVDQVENSIEDQRAEALLDHILKCEQIQIPNFDVTGSFTSSQTPFGTSPISDDVLVCADRGVELLIQDCMWNSHAYEPRSIIGNVNGVYTPAPSPPPISDQTKEAEEPEDSEACSESGSNDINDEPDDVQSECISPCDIFPTYTIVTDKEGTKATPKPRSNTSSVQSEGSRHPQAMSSESGMLL